MRELKKSAFVVALAVVLAFGFVKTSTIGKTWLKSYTYNRFDSVNWGLDLYQFWYAGHFFWHGEEPYTAFLTGKHLYCPPLPQGLKPPENSAFGRPMTILPGSAPLFLVLAPLSLLPWAEATLCWAFINILLGVVYVWLLLRLLELRLFTKEGAALLFILFSLAATRQVIDLGQNSLLICAAMCAAWHLQEGRRPVPAGILLGIAISKYTLGFPMLLYFVYRRWFKAVGIAFLTQLAGLLIIALVSRSGPWQIVKACLNMSLRVMRQTPGWAIHIFNLSHGPGAYVAVSVISLGMLLGLLLWHNSRSPDVRDGKRAGMAMIGIMFLWSFVSMYHGYHDMVAGLPFIALVVDFAGASDGHCQCTLGPWQRKAVYALTAMILAVWIFPLYVVTGSAGYNYLICISNTVGLMLTLRLLFNIGRPRDAADSA